ncbi:MAG: hypothetical protein BWY57_01128 [Betaproteobacteria bacterium ADurb.Bin341]|nr:MAG: hypothetical protein BWY57_01128 [Betaproteobacteria bacterium ADurb.Bin341]
MAEFRLAQHHAGQKGAKSQGQSQVVGCPASQQGDQQHRQSKDFSRPTFGDEVKERPQQPAPGKKHQRKGQRRLGHGPTQRTGKNIDTGRHRQHRNHNQERHRRHILKHRHGEPQPAMRRVQFALLGQLAADQRRRGLGKDCTNDESGRGRHSKRPEKQGDDGRRQHHLRRSEPEHLMPQRMQLRQGIVQSNGKKQEDHTEFSQNLELRH